ncbi:MAG: divalent cation tolerance protein CutA [Pseudomonadota bacterium]
MSDNNYCQVTISAVDRNEANSISDVLVKKRLVAGSFIIKGPSRYWWNGEIVKKEYYNIQSFSVDGMSLYSPFINSGRGFC